MRKVIGDLIGNSHEVNNLLRYLHHKYHQEYPFLTNVAIVGILDRGISIALISEDGDHAFPIDYKVVSWQELLENV